ncbi:MAG: hypothetical protein IKL24_04275 [Clostridia bacterium]|nr:hypothetical protein [Clostridia bacterium]
MGGYIYGIVSAAVFVFIILSLSPDGSKGELGKYVGFVGALTVTLAIILPFPGVIREGEALIEEADTAQAPAGAMEGEYYARIAAEALWQIYGVEKEGVRARVYTDSDGKLTTVELIIPKGEMTGLSDAEKVLSKICSVNVAVKEADDGS